MPNRSLLLLAGNLLLPLRLVLGWTYFSAFWRRLVLENKLIPDQAGYIGEKFNHFLPNALFIDSAIEFFVTHPTLLWWKLLFFTLFEAIVGLALMLGFFTRAAGIATSLLAGGILFGAGWLGTTCLDEWQIGTLGVAAGFVIACTGGGRYSLDYQLASRMQHPIVALLAGLHPSLRLSKILAIGGAALILTLTLFTNQVFHGGVWGKLHNLSVKPRVELSRVSIDGDRLSFQVYRVEGADVYGSFAIALNLVDATGKVVARWDASYFSNMPATDLHNQYVAKVAPGAHSLVIPLGAKAQVTLRDPRLPLLESGDYQIELIDISGASWRAPVQR